MIQDIIQFPFLQNAFLSGILIGFIGPVIGVFLVVRRLSLIADTLSHVALSGVAAGLFLQNKVVQPINPVYVGMVFSIAGALFVENLRRWFRYYQELSLPIVLASATGLSVVLISLADGVNRDLFGYLFGSLIAVSRTDLMIVALIALLVLVMVVLLYKELFYLAFEEEAAVTSGIPKNTIHFVFVLLVALVIAVSMNIVGILLVSAMMTLPVAAGLQLAKSFKQVFVYAVLFSQVSVLTGLVLSYYFDLATGGTIVVLAALLLAGVIFVKKMVTWAKGSPRSPRKIRQV
ncbi:MAG: metal ABC transporter permease [Bacillaceae bacterium]|nr:metal ABC transporter permease [Bacillaceae bacterium]